MSSNRFMNAAVEQARDAADREEVPVGAVLVRNDAIIARAGNEVLTEFDPTAHAEIAVIREACHELSTERLVDCDLYVTLEPCAMCAAAISFARIRRVYFGAYDPKGGGVEHGPCFFSQPTCHHAPEVYGGIMEAECGALLTEFFKEKR